VNELEEVAKLLKFRDELKKEVTLMEKKYEEVLRDQEILMALLKKLKTENRRLLEGQKHGYGVSQKS